jgi:hypothetical protein
MSWGHLTAMTSPHGYRPDRLGKSFCVRDADGAIVRKGYREIDEALKAMDQLELRANSITRPCMACQDLFPSEGPHNRLCDICRATPVSPYAP